jgi:hypothetical protein
MLPSLLPPNRSQGGAVMDIPDAVVWAVCPYFNERTDCLRCGPGDEVTSHGAATRMCYLLAREACERVAAALAAAQTDREET